MPEHGTQQHTGTMSEVAPTRAGPPREAWAVQRRERLLAGLDLSCGRGIEFGPLASPLVQKAEGNVLYVDHVGREALIAKYADDPAVNADCIVEVDVLWDERPLQDCLPGEDGYAYAVASHVIEHVPDFVGWLQEVADVLRPGGLVVLAVPDKRYTFDRFRRLSSLSELIDAYLRRSRRPTPGQLFDQAAFGTQLEAITAWMVPTLPERPARMPDLGHALDYARDAARDGRYVDVHCWVFTPTSFLQAMAALVDLGLLSFRCAAFSDTQPFENEMMLLLEKVDTSLPAAKAEARRSFAEHLSRLRARLREADVGMASGPAPSFTTRHVPWEPLRSVRRYGRHARRGAGPAFAADARLRAGTAAFPNLGLIGRVFPAYQPLFASTEDYVDPGHAALAALPAEGGLLRASTPGFLRHADALVLYELAWHAAGDILELGSAWGLSTTVLCRAACNARRGVRVASVEIAPEFQQATSQAVEALGLKRQLDARPGAADAVMDRLHVDGRTFSVAFVDHDHSLGAVRGACRRLAALLRPGGVAVFHDFNDSRNISEPATYGVYRAVAEMVQAPDWRYLGVLGCCALVQRAEP